MSPNQNVKPRETLMDLQFLSAIHVIDGATTFQENYLCFQDPVYISSEQQYQTLRENAYRTF